MEPKSLCLYQVASSKYLMTMSLYWQIQQSTPKRSTRLVPRRRVAALKSDWRRYNPTWSAPSYKLHLNVRLPDFELQSWLADGVVAGLRRHLRSNKRSIDCFI